MSQHNRTDDDLRRELERIRKDVSYIAHKNGSTTDKLWFWFILIAGLLYGLFVGGMGIAAYFVRHSAH